MLRTLSARFRGRSKNCHIWVLRYLIASTILNKQCHWSCDLRGESSNFHFSMRGHSSVTKKWPFGIIAHSSFLVSAPIESPCIHAALFPSVAAAQKNLPTKTLLQTTFSRNFSALFGGGTAPQRFTLRAHRCYWQGTPRPRRARGGTLQHRLCLVTEQKVV